MLLIVVAIVVAIVEPNLKFFCFVFFKLLCFDISALEIINKILIAFSFEVGCLLLIALKATLPELFACCQGKSMAVRIIS